MSENNAEEQPQPKPAGRGAEGINVVEKMHDREKANGFGPKRSLITLWSLNAISQGARLPGGRADSHPWNRTHTRSTCDFLNQKSRKLPTTEVTSTGHEPCLEEVPRAPG